MRNTVLFILGGLALIIYLNLNSGCTKESSPTVSEYVIATDSVKHADTISAGSSLTVAFYGEVGPNDCYEFLRIDNEFGTSDVELSLIGQFTSRDDCSGGAIYMNPVQLNLSGFTAGTWTLKVLQPDGQATQESTFVVE